jgi:ArsR family transcriptional regulator, arsenate/arsenite/antimonite-responsive transcriptional repressor
LKKRLPAPELRPTVVAMTDQPPTRLSALRALADPVRLALVDELSREGACACELRKRLDLSAPLISHHLKVLREAGLVETRKSGRRLEVELNRDALAAVGRSLGAAA